MKLSDYQARALETALPTALNWDYITNNLLAETYEFAAKVYGGKAKKIRDGKDPDTAALVAELGDIAWHVAVGLSLYEVDSVGKYSSFCSIDTPEKLAESLLEDVNQAYLQSFHEDEEWEGIDWLESVWSMLESFTHPALGMSFDEVLEANLAKLADRKDRGVIGGSGDER